MRNQYRSNKPPLRERLARFFYGRNGFDSLAKGAWWTALVLMLVNMFLGFITLWILELLLYSYSIFRVMSRNIYKRQRENMLWLKFVGKIRGAFSLIKSKHRDRKTHVYKKCPSCKSTLRLPRRPGTHTARCPRCSHRFDVKIR